MAHEASKVRVVGPLAPDRVSFEKALAEVGYTTLSAANVLRLMAHLSRWLEANGFSAGDLAPDVVQAFLSAT